MAYAGILPGMFRDGQGTLVTGRLDASGVFLADEVLAEHDENHLPPEKTTCRRKCTTSPKEPPTLRLGE